MSLGTYNRTPANRKQMDGEKIHVTADLYGNITTIMGAGIAIRLTTNCESAMTAIAGMRHGFDTKSTCKQELTAQASGRISVEWKAIVGAEMSAEMRRILNDKIHLSGELRAKLPMTIWITPKKELYGEIRLSLNSLQDKEITIQFNNITSPPGGVVVIDSEYFTATLNGENIIDLYEGEWPELTSKLKAMEAQGISGGKLQVTVLYRERYL